MTEVKVVIGYKGKSYQKSIENVLIGRKIGEKISGDIIGLKGYELEITGGSDNAGFPMKSVIPGMGRKRILLTKGSVGLKKVKRKGARIRKTVRGNTINNDIAQINLKVLKVGKDELEKIFKSEKPSKEQEKSEKEVKKWNIKVG